MSQERYNAQHKGKWAEVTYDGEPIAIVWPMFADQIVEHANRGLTEKQAYETLLRLAKIEADAKAAGLIDHAGNFRLPTCALFRTKDGVIVKAGEEVYVPGMGVRFEVAGDGTVGCCVHEVDGWRDMRVDECVSTKEAALTEKDDGSKASL